MTTNQEITKGGERTEKIGGKSGSDYRRRSPKHGPVNEAQGTIAVTETEKKRATGQQQRSAERGLLQLAIFTTPSLPDRHRSGCGDFLLNGKEEIFLFLILPVTYRGPLFGFRLPLRNGQTERVPTGCLGQRAVSSVSKASNHQSRD